jgi:N-acetylglucosamine transport system permease protein
MIAAFLAPAVVLYALFVLYPIVESTLISLTRWDGLTPDKEFVGTANFQTMLGDPFFWNALSHNLILAVVVTAITIGLALILAGLVTGRVRGAEFYRFTYFLPVVMSSAVIAVLWAFIYHPTIGLLNSGLALLHLGGLQQTWLGDPNTALGAIAGVYIWADVGFYTVFFVTGIRSIPAMYYEAAQLDGANRAQSFRHITIPLLWGVIRVGLAFEVIAVMGIFTFVFIMTAGGPNRASDVVGTYLFQHAFTYGDFGYASAIATTVLAITLIITVITLRVTRRDAVEY